MRAMSTQVATRDNAAIRVGFDGAMLRAPHTGSGQYSVALLGALAGFPEVSVTVLAPAPLPDMPNAVVVSPPRAVRGERARKVWWEQVGVRAAAQRAGVQLIHTPYFAPPRVQRLPHVVTVHDVIPLKLPAYAGGRAMQAYLRLVSAGARRAAQVITDSECSRDDAIALLSLDPARVTAVPLAVGPEFAASPDSDVVAQVRARLDLGTRRIVFNVAGFDVRKNVAVLLRAFARALPTLPEDVVLVLAGRAHGNPALYPDPQPLVQALGIAARVRFPGAITAAEKIALYHMAACSVAPSRYEGFGLTPLEAMAAGIPVIAADASCTSEVTGDAALLVAPDDVDGFAHALTRVLTDEVFAASLAIRGRSRAALFSWERTVAATVAVYRRALSGRAAPMYAKRAAEVVR